MPIPPDNRAVSVLFRLFGDEDKDKLTVADAYDFTTSQGMHLGEYRAFSILIPLTVFVAIGTGLGSICGAVGGWLLAVPLSFMTLNFLPFILRVKTPQAQWQVWSLICLIWAIFRCGGIGVSALLAYVWIGMTVIGAVADGFLAFQETMVTSGKCGIIWRMVWVFLLHVAAVGIGYQFGWPWGVGAGALIAASGCWAILNPGCQWLGPVYRTTSSKKALITLDDGPDPHDTPVLLDLLDVHQTKAIFFMIGEKVRAHPELAREVARRGHEIGNHTLTHPQASFWCASPWRTWREIAGCQRVIEEVTGKKPRLFRAPVGHRNLFTHPIASALGMEVMAWNRRGYDAVHKDAPKVLARILTGLSPGDIVLLHETTPIAEEVLAGVLKKVSTPIVSRGLQGGFGKTKGSN
jgi:peptidoglycan/xylan/chitin deacetylase (PgdA/CDA1 family)